MLYSFLVALQPYLVPLCAVLAWLLMLLVAASLWGAMREGVRRSQHLHRIPCARCQYFTGDYRLKCTVHPHLALTEQAIGCPDQRPCQSPFALSQSMSQSRRP
ncbi:hypothetical protein [Trichothermofontia sp.]